MASCPMTCYLVEAARLPIYFAATSYLSRFQGYPILHKMALVRYLAATVYLPSRIQA